MISTGQKTSILIPSQLPEFIRDDPNYDNFVSFLQAYYEWLEEDGNVIDRTKNLLNYKDIDKTTDEFLKYYTNDFLPYFPEDALISKEKAVKVARQLYHSKGTPASYQFLFRILYNSDFDLFYTKDAVLKASDGEWYVAKSLKLATDDINFLKINNLRLFGETTKSIATVENSVLAGTKTEVFISNIERLFQSGEFVRVVDSNNQDVLFNGHTLRAKIVGQISQIKVDPNNRGLLYQKGDPAIVYGGLNSPTAHGAIAEVNQTTAGSIQRINVVNGGYGYRTFSNTLINITNAPTANAIVGSLDPSLKKKATVSFLPSDIISLKRNIDIANANYHFTHFPNANLNTKLSDAFSFLSFDTFPISSVIVTNGGGGIRNIPTASAESRYLNEVGEYNELQSMGILAPIQILNGGLGYEANDTIVFTGGSGYGAYANVTSVAANGLIQSVSYVNGPLTYPLGGMGYRPGQLPTLTINSANVLASNASLVVTNVLGDGATFSLVTDRTGSITTVNILDAGEDYVSKPNVSFKVQDIVVSNIDIANLPQKGDEIYQGTNITVASYTALVNSISLLATDANPANSLYNLRVFEYNSTPNSNLLLKINNKNINIVMANIAYNTTYNTNGVRVYGDGNAKGTASFLNGLVISQGQYLSTRGQPSSYDVLQSSIYNNFTYQITVEKEIAKYRDILLNLLHPTGMRMLGRYALKSNASFASTGYTNSSKGYSLAYYTGSPDSYVTMENGGSNGYINLITFNNMNGTNVLDTISPNTTITFTSEDGITISSEVASSNSQTSTVTFTDSVWLTENLTANANSVLIFGTSIFD
jgi:hypothetical protein